MTIKYLDSKRISLLEADRTEIQGYAGGNTPNPSGTGSGAGGGGAGGLGTTPTGNVGGTGGAGLSSSITGSAVTRAGGGGGGGNSGSGTGGSGGGGQGATGGANGGNATVNGSGGGGGAHASGNGGSGSDGIVIIRFTTSGNGYSQAGGTVDSSTVSGQTIISWTATSGTRTFTPTSTFDVQYLILAGGGGGASYYWAGGGGAGGYLTGTDKEVTAQAYTIVVGAGGAVQSTQHTTGNNGSNSSALGLTAIGGGGGSTDNGTANDGGSGGGSGGGGSGVRGEGTSTDFTPTNVQDNSILVEKDTGRRYWFETATAPTYSGDLGTWATDGSQVTESSDVVTMNIQTRVTNNTVTNDLGSALSNSAWVMRCKLILSTITGGGSSTVYLELGVGSASASTGIDNGGVTQDFIGLQQRKSSDTDGWGLVGYDSTGGLDNPESPEMDTDPTTRTYYVEIKRLSTTSMSIGLYDSADYNTLISGLPVETKTDVPSGVTGLRYIRVGNGMVSSESSTGNVIAGTVQDIEIYNGVTSVTPDTWTRQPPSFTASFWGAGGTAGPWTPVNYHNEYAGGTWSTATALGTAVQMVSGCGTKTAGLVIGGDTADTANPISTVQAWNGSAWSTSTGGTMNVARNQHATGGSSISAWACAGRTGSSGNNTSSFWNNSSWTSGATTSTNRRNHGGAGSTDDCWITGGYDESNVLASTEQYNGTAWSAGGNLGTATNSIMGGGGDSYNAIITGGNEGSNSNKTNIYNGTAWSLGGTLTNAHKYGMTSGTPQDAGAYLGYVSSWTPTWSETYNGTSWTTQGNVSNGRATGAGGN